MHRHLFGISVLPLLSLLLSLVACRGRLLLLMLLMLLLSIAVQLLISLLLVRLEALETLVLRHVRVGCIIVSAFLCCWMRYMWRP